MKQRPLPCRIVKPTTAVRRAKLDNIVLVSASMLPLKGIYQPLANKLPHRGVLICDASEKPRLRMILVRVTSFFRSHGRQITVLPFSALAS